MKALAIIVGALLYMLGGGALALYVGNPLARRDRNRDLHRRKQVQPAFRPGRKAGAP